MRRAALLVTVLLSACVSSEYRGAYRVDFRTHLPSSSDVVPYPAEAVWRALPQAYADLGFPGGSPINRADRLYMTPQLRVQDQLYGRRNSEFIDCGRREHGVAFEDQAEVQIAMLTRVEEGTAPGHAVVRTQVDASARRRDVATERITCPSRGVLERAVVEALLARLRSGAGEG